MLAVLLMSFLAIAVVSAVGIASARAVASLPLEVLALAADGGRYAGLGASESAAPAAPSQGFRSHGAVAA